MAQSTTPQRDYQPAVTDGPPVYVLYHGNCPDGWAGAWAAFRALGDRGRYIPVLYGDDPPGIPVGAPVVLVDFSYPRDVLLAMAERTLPTGMLTVLDHHKTAQADLADLVPTGGSDRPAGLGLVVFDMEKSGAMLAWEFWHEPDPAPQIIRYVQDRDLWRFELEHSHEIYAWMSSYARGDFGLYSAMADTLEQMPRSAVLEGKALLRLQRQYVETMCQQAVTLNLAGHHVPVVNASVLFSEAGERLCELHPDAPFAAYYFDRGDGSTQWGLRSRGEVDVSEVAKLYGGGGHHNAAGFTVQHVGKAAVICPHEVF